MTEVVLAKYCPEREVVSIPAHWYYIPAAKGLGICSRCYHDHLSATPFAGYFQVEYDSSGNSRYCDFSYPRMLGVLKQALSQNNFQALQDYIVYRSRVPRCKGGGGIVKPEDGFEWFEISDEGLKGQFAVCRACYEDYIVPGGFTPHFANPPIHQSKEQLYTCDLAWRFTRRLVSNCSDWNQVITYALYRNKLPKCDFASWAEAGSRTWCKFKPNDLDGLWFCEACFYDAGSMTIMEDHLYQPQQQVQADLKVRCAANGWPSLKVAWEAALHKQDFNVFYRAAQAFLREPICSDKGFASNHWYTLNPPEQEVDICRACYEGIFVASDAGHFLIPKNLPPGASKLCNMNLASPHVVQLYNKLDLAVEMNNPRIFADFTRRMATIPLCSRGALENNKRWYRHDMFSACPACWIEVIEGTALESCFVSRNEIYEPQLKCDFYSARVRGLWKEACAKNDLPGFVAFMKKRLEIWSQTYPQIQQQLAMMRMNAMRQQTLLMSSTMLNGANNIAAAAGVHGNYGNSSIGWGYETYAGAEGANQWNQAMGMFGANGGAAMSIVQLEGLWKSVE